MDHVFISIAASSYRIKESEVIDIAGIRTNGQIGSVNKTNILSAFTTKVMPKGKVDVECGRLVGFSESEWINSPEFKSAIKSFKDSILSPKFNDKYTVVTHISDIARNLLTIEYERIGETEELFCGHTWIDTAQLAWPLLFSGIIKSRMFESLCTHFKVELQSQIDTADRCTALVSIYNHLMRRYKTALVGEQAIREVGGESLEGLRRIIGF